MSVIRQSKAFKWNIFFWALYGIWAKGLPPKYYKYYSAIFLGFTLIFYNILLTLNLIYTPRTIELIIREGIFYITEIAVISKILMIMMMRNEIIEAFNLLDCEQFGGGDDIGRKIVHQHFKNYKKYFTCYAIFCHFTWGMLVTGPGIKYFILLQMDTNLPVCKYYFLSDEFRDKYYTPLFFYQSVGMYIHMKYNVNIDTFIPGLISMAITQLKVLSYKLASLKKAEITNQDSQIEKLNECLRHYELILKYCSLVQKAIDMTMFVQYGVASSVICAVLFGLSLPSTSKDMVVFMVPYLGAMIIEIFLPALMGTKLTVESRKLVFAAYNSDWIAESEPFKRNMRIFVERANTPIVLQGMKIFSLSLETFLSIIKTAYSFFTLVRRVQDTQSSG